MPDTSHDVKLYETFRESVKKHLYNFLDMHSSSASPGRIYETFVNEVEKVLIEETLKYSSNIQSKASKLLGINRNTLRKKMHLHNIKEAIENKK